MKHEKQIGRSACAGWSAGTAWIAGITMLALPLVLLAWSRDPAQAEGVPRAGNSRTPLPPEYLDQGMACLASGVVEPELEELSDAELLTAAEIVGRLIHAYERGSFESFLALRAADLEHAAEARAEDVWQARAFVRELGQAGEELDRGDWVETLGRYWAAYYAEPPVGRFLHERTVAHLHREGLGGGSLEDWQRSFEVLREREGGQAIQHQLAIPHRRDIVRVAGDAGPLCWLDLELAFETRGGATGRLVARFVWDAVHREWFLQAAATAYANGARVERHLVL